MNVILDKQFGKRYLLRNVTKIIPLLVGFFFLCRDWGRFGLELWIGIASFVGGILYWAWQDSVMFSSYHCSQCGRHLPKPTIQEPRDGDPIRFHCEACDIEWDTGLRN